VDDIKITSRNISGRVRKLQDPQ